MLIYGDHISQLIGFLDGSTQRRPSYPLYTVIETPYPALAKRYVDGQAPQIICRRSYQDPETNIGTRKSSLQPPTQTMKFIEDAFKALAMNTSTITAMHKGCWPLSTPSVA